MAEPTNEEVIPESPVETPTISLPDAKPPKARDIGGWIILGGAIAAVGWGFAAAVGSGFGFWDWSLGLRWVRWSAYLALAVFVLGIFLGARAKKTGSAKPRVKRWLGVLMTACFLGWLMTYVIASWSVPDIHDVSTDLADPPEFRVLTVRPDNFDNVPGATNEEMKGMTPKQRWVVVHQKSYGDVRSVGIDQPVADVIAKAERLSEDRGWNIAVADATEGRLEATDTSPLFRFKEDVVLRVRPTQNGMGSIVDMRSVSRVGQNDQGTNAKRIRAFLSDLTGTVSTGQ